MHTFQHKRALRAPMKIHPAMLSSLVSPVACVGIAITLLLGGCAAPALTVAKTSPLTPSFENGVPTLRSQKVCCVLVGQLSQRISTEPEAFPTFCVAITNGTRDLLAISPENFSAVSGGKRVRVLNQRQHLQLIARSRLAAERFARMDMPSRPIVGRDAAGNLHQYSRTPHLPTGRDTYSPVSVINAAYPSAFPKTAAAQDGQPAQPRRQLGCLTRCALPPGMLVRGLLVLHGEDIQRGKPLTIIATIAGETHEFQFEVGP